MPAVKHLPLRVTDPSHDVQISYENDSTEAITVPQLFSNIVTEYSQHTALVQQNPDTKEWEKTTYAEYKEQVDHVAKVFIQLGLERYGTVAILAHNSVQWFVSEMAAIHAGGLATGIYLTNSAQAVLYVLENSKATIVVVDEQHQLNKILEVKDKLKHLKAIIQILPTESVPADSLGAVKYLQWNELTSIDTSNVKDEYQARLASIAPNQACSIVYTSGTTGTPKGALLSHDNITWTIGTAKKFVTVMDMGCETVVSYLPLAHVAGQCTDMFLSLSVAATVYFADKNALKGTLVNTLKVVRPTLFAGVPRVYEKFQERMLAIGAQAGTIKRLVAKWAKKVTLDHHLRRMAGDNSKSLQYELAKSVILGRVKEAIGFDRMKLLVVGAAPIEVETKKYFCSLDMPLVDLYGMTECTLAHCMSKPDYKYMTSVGAPLPGTVLKISNPDPSGHGEFLIKGRNIFMGYIYDQEKTLEAFDDDGWLKTGDIGYVDENGYAYITGRIKEIVITAGGENVPPVHVESLVKAECGAISNAFLVGDKRKFLTMLITLKTEIDVDGNPLDELAIESLQLMEQLGLSHRKLSQVLDGPDPEVTRAIDEAIGRANKHAISNAQKVQKFAFLPHDFSLPTGELGPTMKLKRHFVVSKYKDIIDRMYE